MKILFSKQAQKDYERIKKEGSLLKRARALLEIIEKDPFQNPPPYEALIGDLKGAFSRRINNKHRLVYRVVCQEVWVIAMWTHYAF